MDQRLVYSSPLDGSRHVWLALQPGAYQTLLAVVDDATKHLLYAHNELRVAGIRTVADANRYLTERFIADYNRTFGRPPADPTSAFAPVSAHDLDQILCHEEERIVGRDNTVTLDQVVLQIDKQRGRRSCAGLRVLVCRHLDDHHSVWWGPRCLGRFSAQGQPLPRAA